MKRAPRRNGMEGDALTHANPDAEIDTPLSEAAVEDHGPRHGPRMPRARRHKKRNARPK